MKKRNRLLKNEDFKKVLDNKKSFANSEYVIYKKSNNLNYLRVGISVSSKIGNSVVRHKIKRQINEMLKNLISIDESSDYVIIARKNFLFNDFFKNKKNLESLISKFGKEIL